MTTSATIRKGTSIISIYYTHQSKVAYINTGISVTDVKNFVCNGRQFLSSKETNHELKNRAISKKLEEVEQIVFLYKIEHGEYPEPKQLSELLNRKTKGSKIDLSQLQRDFLKHRAKDNLSGKTIELYTTLFSHLKDFGKSLSKVNEQWVFDFAEHLRSKEISKNSIATYMGKLKPVLSYLNETKQTDIESKVISSIDTRTDKRYIFYFQPREIKAIYNLEFSGIDKHILELARDRFIFQCETGLRPSDIESPSWYLSNGILHIMPKKTTESTGAVATIPLSPEAIEIFTRYNGNIPHIEKSAYYKLIREIGRLAGIDEQITMVRGRGKRSNGEVVCKWQLMEPRSARSHFACQALRSKKFSHDEIAVMMGITVSTLLGNYSAVDTGALSESANNAYRERGGLRYSVNEFANVG